MNELPASSVHPCSCNSVVPPEGTCWRGAHHSTTPAARAHSLPPGGRSAAQASHSSTGTAHTRWCSQVMGETTIPVVAQTRIPRNGDDSAHAHRANAIPATRTNAPIRSMTTVETSRCARRSREPCRL